MSENFNKLILESIPDQQAANELIGRLFDITSADAVYSQPITVGDHTIINASEYSATLGMGYGGGGGVGPNPDEATQQANGYGGGGGGGGATMSRPVAAIIISPSGVRVEPIVDVTKIAITLFTALGAMAMALRKMKR
ncbi:MAG: hypothetical protein H6657_15975 [Ardenticatenaceae bacterium]|nr:hypothetical protein [Anaerolineales bacterium]MCB8978914.1 hypothetical protein [Ardenticatenaceae bacterium]